MAVLFDAPGASVLALCPIKVFDVPPISSSPAVFPTAVL